MTPRADWEPLVGSRARVALRGAVFRCPGVYPHERRVDFMLVESRDAASGFALMVVSGYKAGLVVAWLPAEARDANSPAVSVRWLKQNWRAQIYERGPDEVFFAPAGYTVPVRWRGPARR